jgi:hypothetical protein
VQVHHVLQTRAHALEHVANVLEYHAGLPADIDLDTAIRGDAHTFKRVVGPARTGSRHEDEVFDALQVRKGTARPGFLRKYAAFGEHRVRDAFCVSNQGRTAHRDRAVIQARRRRGQGDRGHRKPVRVLDGYRDGAQPLFPLLVLDRVTRFGNLTELVRQLRPVDQGMICEPRKVDVLQETLALRDAEACEQHLPHRAAVQGHGVSGRLSNDQ